MHSRTFDVPKSYAENGTVTGLDAGRTESTAHTARTGTASASALVRVRTGAVAFQSSRLPVSAEFLPSACLSDAVRMLRTVPVKRLLAE